MEIEYHNRKLEVGKIYYVGFEHSRMEVLEIIPETEEDYEKIKVKFLDREPYAGRTNTSECEICYVNHNNRTIIASVSGTYNRGHISFKLR